MYNSYAKQLHHLKYRVIIKQLLKICNETKYLSVFPRTRC